MRRYTAILGIACLVATAACGGEGVSPTDGTMPSNQVMEAPTAFHGTAQGLTVESQWQCTQTATWGVNAIAEGMESSMVVFNTTNLSGQFTLPTQFVGKTVTLWVQRLDQSLVPFGPKSNRIQIGPITIPVQQDECGNSCTGWHMCLNAACACPPASETLRDGMQVACDGSVVCTLRARPETCGWDCVAQHGVRFEDYATATIEARCVPYNSQ